MNDNHTLRWTPGPSPLPDLPTHITRRYIPTPSGNLEILVAQPPASLPLRPEILLFQHGGFGCASVWLAFLSYFSQIHGFRCYALSLRGHGGSWKPGFWSMVWGTGRRSLCGDLGCAMGWVMGFENGARKGEGFGSERIVLVGHSAGGGLVQDFLSRGMGKVGGLVILAGFPCFGGLGVYAKWFGLDPWFVPRFYLKDLWHPRSPLSSTSLVHRAFFCPSFPVDKVREFERFMPEYESLLWPIGMMLAFVNVKKVLSNILGWSQGQQRLLVVAGEKDTLMGVFLMRRMATKYRRSFITSVRRLLLSEEKEFNSDNIDGVEAREGVESSVDGTRFVVIKGSGHHLQNDLQWEECAVEMLDFVNQL